MPGLYGHLHHHIFEEKNEKRFVKYFSPSLKADTYKDAFHQGIKRHLGIIGDQNSPFIKNGVTVWVLGEAEIDTNQSLANLLYEAYLNDTLTQTLKPLSGYFAAVIVDPTKRKVTFISDRFGMKHLNIATTTPVPVWSSRIDWLLNLGFPFCINKQAAEQLIKHGYLLGETTWLEGCRLLPAATIAKYNFDNQLITEERYWSWADIKPLDISFDQAAQRLGDGLKSATIASIAGIENPILPISGGLDSRCLLAHAATYTSTHATAFTFGLTASSEVILAKKAVEKSDLPWHLYQTDPQAWFDSLPEAVAQTEGAVSVGDLHFGQHHAELSDKQGNMLVNGFAGGVIAGGCALPPLGSISIGDYARKLHGSSAGVYTNPTDPFYAGRSDAYNLDQRQRRCTHIGSVHTFPYFEDRRPFLHSAVFETVYGVPDSFRANYRLYHKALLLSLPDWYHDIPWHYTSLPISKTVLTQCFLRFKVRGIQRRLGILPKHFSNDEYPLWLAEPARLEAIKKTLLAAENSSPISFEPAFKSLTKHQSKQNQTDTILRFYTLALWLLKFKGDE
jgi:asparagine synthase (glutamine-hydrolysing)